MMKAKRPQKTIFIKHAGCKGSFNVLIHELNRKIKRKINLEVGISLYIMFRGYM